MPRKNRVIVPNNPHHVTQRGVRKLPIFYNSDDYRLYLNLFTEVSKRHGLKVLAYCLMPNHVHFIVLPLGFESLAKTIQDVHSSYPLCFNRKYGLRGHVFESRFYSVPMHDTHTWTAIRYVELNPVRASIVGNPLDYRWSSAQSHCGMTIFSPVLDSEQNLQSRLGQDWKTWLQSDVKDEEFEIFRKSTRNGRPVGTQDFLKSLEQKLGQSFLKKRSQSKEALRPLKR